MDTDGFPLAAISERSTENDTMTSINSIKRDQRAPLRPIDSIGGIENGSVSSRKVDQPAVLETNTRSGQLNERISTNTGRSGQLNERVSSNTDRSRKYNQFEVTSIQDEDDELDNKYISERPSQLTVGGDSTMVSSYTTGGENDIIEIHQFSLADIDAYLDIYFETLHSRLRHYIGQDEQIQQFRIAMKNRINTNPNAREFQNVLLGKMNGEVLAAITMAFPDETPTISQASQILQQNSCLSSIRRWFIQKANYIPTHMEECYIEMIGVKSGYRNNGIGTAMLECVEQFARQAGASRLTVHTNGPQSRHYFERYGFILDNSDSSAFWKWVIERQSIDKLTRNLASVEENDYAANSYINESMTESVERS
ncbi:unnamed protein product [Adineta steineri]|uniref:N-acetyltransferase domain-containing protein n=1 Tax=Adineta steineri TaxID=433720 RepID=A0A814TPV9_9BILA|nr:unnamed protein product [Adineta steineri]CAF3500575.1 unnamed protein product [Adineta steineri]